MAAKRCPNCNLVNPGSSQVCDCGYSFVGDYVGTPLVTKKPDEPLSRGERMIAARMFMILIVLGIGLVIALVGGLKNMF